MASAPLGQLLPSCKRRRVAAHTSARTVVCINDLSAEILKEVATYLAPPSRILFAVAVTPPSSPYEIIMARSRSRKQKSPWIVGTDWATLDFGQIEKALAAKLSDEDVRDALLHINSANKVKRLFLTNCTNITGAALSPLRGSTTIEQIDLSLVGLSQDPHLNPKPPISCGIVLPILDSIISNEALCKLKYLHFPKAWRLMARQKSTGLSTKFPDLHDFLVRYNQLLENRGQVCCLKCNQEVTPQWLQPTIAWNNRSCYGTQRNFCHQCSNYVCRSCPTEDDNVDHHFCSACEREYCEMCVPMAECSNCRLSFCPSCFSHSCASPNCEMKLCGDCKVANECDGCKRTWCEGCHLRKTYMCEFCDKICCDECSEKDHINGVHYCDARYCDNIACSSCLIEQLQEGKLDCMTCMKRAAPLIKQLKDEIEELKEENEELHKRVRNLEERKQSLD